MKKIVLYCLAFVSFYSFLLDDTNSFKELVRSKLYDYTNQNWPEKIYIHTDKPYYALDEDLWFSTYLVNGITHKASSKSNVVYVELINDRDSIVATQRLFVNQMSTGGHFKIKKEWSPGKYLLRAYTNYMRNEDSKVFFQKDIQVISLDQEKTESSIKSYIDHQKSGSKQAKPDLEFFPEGGYLVNNINSKVAIKIKDSQYDDYKVPIQIVDSKGNEISRFTSVEFGLGFFHINPKLEEDYYANLNLNGEMYQYLLPKALPEGYALTINSRKDELLIKMSSSKSTGLKNSYLVIHQRGQLLFDKITTTSEKSDTLNVNTGILKDGVVHITLFDSGGQPMCERLVFVDNPKNNISFEISTNKEDFETREKVTLDLQLKNTNEQNLYGNISMAIRDLEIIPYNENQSSIKTWLLLNSDLRGKIENPGYFFSKGEKVKKAFLLDLTMMTNGWRRFTWQNILYDRSNDVEFDIEKGITISGTTMTLKPPHKDVSAINTITFLGKQSIGRESVNSNKFGKFSFGPYVFYDSIQTIIESKLIDPTSRTDGTYRNVLISIDKKTHKNPDVKRFHKGYVSSNNSALKDNFLETAEYIRDLNLAYDKDSERLDEVVLTTTLRTNEQERQKEMENRSYFGAPTRRLDMESDTFLPNTPLRLIFQRFPGVRVGNRSLYYRGEICRLLFNNIEVDLDFISSLNPADISFIDFYDPSNSVYSRAPGGVFTIYGKLGVDPDTKKTPRLPGIVNFTAKGFDKPKEFYAPDYSKNINQMTKTDIRTTLHWEPKISFTDKNPSKSISFYTCDLKRTYVIEIEGITANGIPIHEISYLSVN
jgi:hypothetical protein